MKRLIALLLCVIIGGSFNISFCNENRLNSALEKCGDYILENVQSPSFGVTGGEWAVIGLARSKRELPDNYFDEYYSGICDYVSSHQGVLHRTKNTEYSRLVIALTAIGKDPSDVSGYNLLMPLSDYEKTLRQGINGPVWALLALDSGDYEIPDNPDAKVKATRETYIDYILSKQTKSGGWSLSGDEAEADITGMVLCALSGYKDSDRVKAAIEKAILKMSEIQTESGGFLSYNSESLESAVQMVVALCSLGISPDDARFVKNGNGLIKNILSYMLPSGGFLHSKAEGKENQLATEQAFYALVAAKRYYEGKNPLYDMSDIAKNKDLGYNHMTEAEFFGKIKMVIEKLKRQWRK